MKQGGIASLIWAADSPHTEQYSQLFNASYYPISFLHTKNRLLIPIRYLLQSVQTLRVLLRQRPHTVHVINTPVFAAMCVYLYCVLTGSSYIMDVLGHSMSGSWAWSKPIQRLLSRRALVNIVDQEKHIRLMEEWGVPYVVLERPPVGVPSDLLTQISSEKEFTITLVCTFAPDEPVDLVIESARQLSDVQFYITGKTEKADPDMIANVPENVHFTGYISGEDYWNQLNGSNAIMTLTMAPYSLVSGGVEAMAMHKPIILSRQPALVDYFSKGTVFVDHSVESMVDGIQRVKDQEQFYKNEVVALAKEKQERWHQEFQKMLDMIGERRAK